MAKTVKKVAKITKGEDVKPIAPEMKTVQNEEGEELSKPKLKAEKKAPKFNQPGTNRQKVEIE